jgi:hypothetical protein
MANNPPFAALNHVAGDLGIPSESALLRIGITQPLITASTVISVECTTASPEGSSNLDERARSPRPTRAASHHLHC